MIFLTGASGNLGSAVLERLLKLVPANKVAALDRNPNRAKILKQKGISVFIGEYADKASLLDALKGVEKLLLVSGNGENALGEHKNVIDAAKESGVKHIYYTGGALNKNVQHSQLGPLTDSYITTENYIIESGLTYTIFQNGLYAETIPYFIGEQVLETGISFPAGEGKSSFAKRAEMGEAIANVLASEGHENKTYLLTTLPSYSFREIAEILSELSGKNVSYTSPEPEEYEAQLKEYGVSDSDIWYSLLLAAIIKNNEYNITDSDLEKLLGYKPTSLDAYLKETFLK
ncbi:SDR family oxidoreductase [Dyadobacter diqingensis]|uniref:SDR family oxidoreductase n=1 Tax=Dyadobacter diqingensis TaxID=2938121 RepID=UPI0020C1B40E|nr:SDR family oxidoreductase [Dyadobacter diqingensis]